MKNGGIEKCGDNYWAIGERVKTMENFTLHQKEKYK